MKQTRLSQTGETQKSALAPHMLWLPHDKKVGIINMTIFPSQFWDTLENPGCQVEGFDLDFFTEQKQSVAKK